MNDWGNKIFYRIDHSLIKKKMIEQVNLWNNDTHFR